MSFYSPFTPKTECIKTIMINIYKPILQKGTKSNTTGKNAI